MARQTSRKKTRGTSMTKSRKVGGRNTAASIVAGKSGPPARKAAAKTRKTVTAKSTAKGAKKSVSKKAVAPKRAGRLTKVAARKTAPRKETRPRKAAMNRRGPTRAQLYAEIKKRGIEGCSRMSKDDLAKTLKKAGG